MHCSTAMLETALAGLLEATLQKPKNNSDNDVSSLKKNSVTMCHTILNSVRRFYALDYTEQDFSDSTSRDAAEKKATKGCLLILENHPNV